MNQSPNSPKAQEVKAVKAWAVIHEEGRIHPQILFPDKKEALDYIGEASSLRYVEVLITPITSENQPPLADKSLLNPNPLSCQSDGNREKELEDALEWMAESQYGFGREKGEITVREIYGSEWEEDIFGTGSTPLLAIQSAMKSEAQK